MNANKKLLESITNYLEVSPYLGTGGQPTPEQIAALAEAGYQGVINLAQPDSRDALPEEDTLVTAVGMEYVHLPVSWSQPQLATLRRFFALLATYQEKRVFVHCIKNYRVAVYVYLYRVLRQGVAPEEAEATMERIWSPNATWRALIQAAQEDTTLSQTAPPDNLARARRNVFVTDSVSRLHGKRGDTAWLEERLHAPETRFAVFWHEQVLASPENAPAQPVLLGPDELAHTEISDRLDQKEQLLETVLLGQAGPHTYFALNLNMEEPPAALAERGSFQELRELARDLDPERATLLAQAKAMLHWHAEERYCGRCGTPTIAEEGGYLRRCTNPDCEKLHFPRTDPAIIVLVTSDDHCLLGRQPHWPPHRYSNIAGFVEPGESLEMAVVREVWEETAVRVREMRYHSSQPWPFPRSLMLGFTALASSEDIRLQDEELEDARWFTRAEIRKGLEQGTLGLPSPYSISYRLIEDWFDAGTEGKLAEHVGEDSW